MIVPRETLVLLACPDLKTRTGKRIKCARSAARNETVAGCRYCANIPDPEDSPDDMVPCIDHQKPTPARARERNSLSGHGHRDRPHILAQAPQHRYRQIDNGQGMPRTMISDQRNIIADRSLVLPPPPDSAVCQRAQMPDGDLMPARRQPDTVKPATRHQIEINQRGRHVRKVQSPAGEVGVGSNAAICHREGAIVKADNQLVWPDAVGVVFADTSAVVLEIIDSANASPRVEIVFCCDEVPVVGGDNTVSEKMPVRRCGNRVRLLLPRYVNNNRKCLWPTRNGDDAPAIR